MVFVTTLLGLDETFCKHLLDFVVHSLPLGSSMFGTHGWGSSWWRNREWIRRHSSSYPTVWSFARVLDFFHMNSNTMPISQFLAQSGHCLHWKGFRKAPRSLYCPCRWSTSSTFLLNVLISSVSFKSCRNNSCVRVILELLNQLFDRFFAIRVLLLDCRMRNAWHSVVDVAVAGFPRNFPMRFSGLRDVAYFLIRSTLLSTLRIRLQYEHETTLETDIPVWYSSSLVLMYTAFSITTRRQRVCRERLRVIVFW